MLYRERFDSFLRIAAAITGDLSSAHDAVQDGFVRALRSLASFRGEAPLEAWVWRIVVNAARDARAPGEVALVASSPHCAEQAASENGSGGDFAV